MTQTKRSSRILAFLLTLLLVLQSAPVMSARAEGQSEAATALPESIFTEAWNQEYDVLYHEAGKSYTYQGEAVTFPDGNTVKVGETSHTIKNVETTVTTSTENGKTTVSFTNLGIPVDYIQGEWSSQFAGKFAICYQLNGTPVKSAASDRFVTSITVDTPADGTYTLTGGKLYEACNEWSGGYDFGQGLVKEREFGYLPDVTIVIGSAQPEPVEPPAEKPVPEITAKIADQELTITEVENNQNHVAACKVQHTYKITVPEELQTQEITITGLDGYKYRDVRSAQSCWGSLTKVWPGNVAVNEFGYHLHDLKDNYAPEYKDLHIIFEIEPAAQVNPEPEQPAVDIPFTARIGDQQLKIVDGGEVDCLEWGKPAKKHSYCIMLPAGNEATQFTYNGMGGQLAENSCEEYSGIWLYDESDKQLDILKDGYYHIENGSEGFHITFKEETPLTPEEPEVQPIENAPFTARLGETKLIIEDAGQVHCDHTNGYSNGPEGTVQGYRVVIPAGTTETQFVYNGIGGNLAVNNCEEYSNWLYDERDKQLDILDSNGFYHFHSGSTVFHITFRHLSDAGEQISATARDIPLKLEKVYGRDAYTIHIPAAVKGSVVSVKGLNGYHYEEVGTDRSGDITGVWEAKILEAGKEYKLTNASGKELFLLFDREQAKSVNVRFNVQMEGAFLLPPMEAADVEAGLAGFYGYTYDKAITENDVTVLDALVKIHQMVLGAEDVSDYLSVREDGWITKVFGMDASLGYLVNGAMTATTANQTILADGDTFTLFNYQDTTSYGDKIVWLEQGGKQQTRFDAAVNTPLTLTVKSADWNNNVTPVPGVQLARVDETGKITPIENAVTNNQGAASVTFATPGTYTITVISSEATKVVMPIAYVDANEGMVSLSAEARTAGKGDLIPMTTLPIMKEGCTVKDVLDTLAEQNQLVVKYSEQGAILSIGDLGTNAEGGGWRCFLNGEAISQSTQTQTVKADDVIRIRYAVSAAGSELEAPLYQYLKTRTEQAKEKLLDNYTESSKRALQAAVAEAETILADPQNNSADTNKELQASDVIAKLNLAEAELVKGSDSTADSSIPDDFENDLWLQYDFKEMKIGDTAKIYPRRVPQIIDDPISNKVTRPNFHFDVVRGSSVTLSGNESTESVSVTAVRDGITVVKVTYDACGSYGASSPINTAYVVFQVNSDPADLTINTSLSAIRSYDTIYYADGDTVPYTFTVDVPGADKVEVTCNDQVLTANEDGTYTANLENRSNVLGIEAVDAAGKVKSYYHVVDARKIQIIVQNLTNPGQPIKINDRAKVSFHGITMPVYKLATIYNPCFGGDATHVYYRNEKLGEFKGSCKQWDLATNNSFEVLFKEAGDYTFTDGKIPSAWWGQPLGTDKVMEGKGEPGMGAPTVKETFSMLPDFTIKVADETSSHVPVENITLNKNELTLKEGESFQLIANVLPEDATNRNFKWQLSNGTGYFITMDENGKITAHHANHENVPFVTVTVTTEDGHFTASCKVTVVKADVAPEPSKPEPTVLNGGKVTVAAPVKGKAPEQASTEDTGYKIVSTKWNPDHKTFAANTAYTVEIVLEAKDGEFAKDAAFTINGKTAEVKENTGKQVTITLNFAKTANPAVPQTGDNSMMILWIAVAVIALLGSAALICIRISDRKRNNISE